MREAGRDLVFVVHFLIILDVWRLFDYVDELVEVKIDFLCLVPVWQYFAFHFCSFVFGNFVISGY